ncbi:3-oxoacyl-acyl-carrier-protein reductase FabG [Porphyridium purpureum]|uniref:3-oxoacyl-acyl-carrier-protein reductase FabG n=1 Tax=Porphyridium purpureum TaxID=35688 RepID=A0A5J4YK97_PORPP|nr:3-oxoacyl-acyl-carrier-protein reductase FabG [Porphyridium purpureum]|eukprot:POR9343..scf291_13
MAGMDKVCVVVGLGGDGIGDHVARKFAAEGYKVAMLARTKPNLDALQASIPNSRGFVADATDPEQVRGVVTDVLDKMGGIDVLVYNVGVGVFKSFHDTTEHDLDIAWSSGPRGLFAFAKAVIPHFEAQGHGVIGVTGATASWRGMPITCAFASAKFGVRAMCQALAREFGPKGIHVFHVIIDGLVGMPKSYERLPDKPRDDFLDAKDIADAYFFVATQPKRSWTYELNLGAGARSMDMISI